MIAPMITMLNGGRFISTVFTYPAYKLPKSRRQKPLPTPSGSIDQMKSAGSFNVQTGDCSFLETRRAGRAGIDIYEVLNDIVVTFPSFEEDFKFCNPHPLATLRYVEYANYRTGSKKR